MFDLKEMIVRLSNCYWSPRPPQTYLTVGANGQPAGLGLLAHENVAAFNITWAICPLVTFEHHKVAIMHWSQLNRQLDVRIGHEHLDFVITSRTREQFKAWYRVNKVHIRLETRMFLDKV